jgi:hypothetical protein
MRTTLKICALIIFASQGCIDEMSLELPFEEPLLMADIFVSSDAEESSITIGWTSSLDAACYEPGDFGMGYFFSCPPDTSKGPYEVTGRISIKEETGKSYEYEIHMADKKSYINIKPAIAGTPGLKYSMDIEINYQGDVSTYHAETEMLATPVIEKTSYEIRKGDVGKSDDFVPLIYFHEPQEMRNYYLFKLCAAHLGSGDVYCGTNRVWPYSIIKDDFLPSYVNGLSIDDGGSVAKYGEWYPSLYYPGDGIQVTMYSVTKATYDFYKASLDQFNNDGGAYSPTPATPPGNISGGAIGLFRALHRSSGTVYLE